MTQIIVKAKPVTQGSVHAITVNGKARVIHNKSKELYAQRELIQALYHDAGGIKHTGGVEIELVFTFVRPKSVSAKKRPHVIVKPDIDKLERAVLDALTHHAYDDDAQVVKLSALKTYGDEEGIEINVHEYHELNNYI